MIHLESALSSHRDSLSAFCQTPTLFGKSLRVTYSMNEGGWDVRELGIFARIYFIVAPIFRGKSLFEANQATLEKYQERIGGRRQKEDTVSLLLPLFQIEDSFKNRPSPTPSPQPVKPQRDPNTVAKRNKSLLPQVETAVQSSPTLSAGKIKGIRNSSSVNCWINSSVQTLLNLPPFVQAIQKELIQNPGENSATFKKREAIQTILRALLAEYQSDRSSPSSLERHVENLKNHLHLLSPATFIGRSPTKTQQCATTSIGTLLKALGLDDATLRLGCPLIKLPLGESLEKSLESHFQKVNCRMNEALQVLFWLTPFTCAIHQKLSERANEAPQISNLRQEIQKTLQEIHNEYQKSGSHPASIQMGVEKLKGLYYAYYEKHYRGTPEQKGQPWTSSSIGPLLEIFDLHKDPNLKNWCPFDEFADAESLEGSFHNYYNDSSPENPFPNKIVKAPPFLVLQTQFVNDATQTFIPCDKEKWKAPLELDLGRFPACGKDGRDVQGRYRLVGVIHHHGGAWACGHYTSTIVGENGGFVTANDSIVSRGSHPSSYNGISIYERLPS